jgi:hypothetical protein
MPEYSGQTDTELALALVLIVLGEPAQALARSRHALQSCQAAGDDPGQAVAMTHMGRANIIRHPP